jgi:hypothetical protein
MNQAKQYSTRLSSDRNDILHPMDYAFSEEKDKYGKHTEN